jgi:hypothetical protein
MNHKILAIVVALAVAVALVGTVNLLPMQAYAKHSKHAKGTLASDSTVNQGQGPQGIGSANPNDPSGGQQGPLQSTAAPGNSNNNAAKQLAAMQLMQQMQGANPNGGSGGQQAPAQQLMGPATGSAGPSNTAAAPTESLAQVMGLVKDFLGQR